MLVLDQFQIDAVSDIKSNNNVLVVAPTGSGKTLIAEKSIEYYLKKKFTVSGMGGHTDQNCLKTINFLFNASSCGNNNLSLSNQFIARIVLLRR